jgi:hypothetical protein
MLSNTLSINIPGVSTVLNKLDGMRAKFLAVPANTRMALDKLSRIRRTMNRTDGAGVTVAQNEEALKIENGLKRVQLEWNTSAERFSMLDGLRRDQKALSMDGVTIASQLAMSAGYVIKNADTNIAAVDKLAEKYLTAAQRAELGAQTTGASSVSPLLLAGLLGVGLLVFRARR